jgi:GDP-L-fucose synthase
MWNVMSGKICGWTYHNSGKNDMDFFADKSVWVTGGHGFLGKHLVRKLEERGAYEIINPTRKELDLMDWIDVYQFVTDAEPDIIFHLAAHVGGISYNLAHPANLLHDNSVMAINAVKAAYVANAKMVAAGSVCAYPEYVPTPAIEKNFYSGSPEPSNRAYGNSKRLLLEMQRAYWDEYDLPGAHLVSSNLYGPGDNFDPSSSHVIPALIVKIQNAIDNGNDTVVVWGTGKASRDMLYVTDAVDAYLIAAELIDEPCPVNIASNRESPIHFIVSRLIDIMGYEGELVYDKSKPDGQLRRNFQINRMIELTGWTPEVSLDEGLSRVVSWFRREIHEVVPL